MDLFGHRILDEFSDAVVVTDIYPAGEAAIPGVTVEALAEAIRPAVRQLHVVTDLEALPGEVARLARPGDLIITLGAGSIARVSGRIVGALADREARR